MTGPGIDGLGRENKASDTLIATHFREGSGRTGQVAFQRKPCVFPKSARYIGGDNHSASSSECAYPRSTP